MVCFKLLQWGVVKVRAESGRGQSRQHLQITLTILRMLHRSFIVTHKREEGVMLWAAAALRFWIFQVWGDNNPGAHSLRQ